MHEITCVLDAIDRAEPRAASELLPLVYDELRQLAAQKLAQEKPGQTLDATALVHEAYMRLVGGGKDGDPRAGDPIWANRRHFCAAAAEAMRRILVENARRKRTRKHGGEFRRQDPEAAQLAEPEPAEDLLALDEALNKLATKDPLKAELVKLRYFAGMTIEEAASALGVSAATAKRWWTYTRAWLYQEISGESAGPGIGPPG